jgi:hypothetical protein
MNVITLIIDFDEPFGRTFLTDTRLVSPDQENGPTTRIESERDSPYAAVSIETQLFHVAVLLTVPLEPSES